MEHEPFTWFGALGLPEKITTAAFVGVLLVTFAIATRRRLATTSGAIDPEDGVTSGNIAEVFVESISSLAEGVIGHGAERYVPLLATFFVFILVSNLIGLVPGFSPPTSDFNITLGLG